MHRNNIQQNKYYKGGKINELNTIIILTKNNQDCITKTLKELKKYIDKHPSTTQIIISDNASNDETLPKIIHFIHQTKDNRFLLITQEHQKEERKTLLIALEQVQTPITITLEPQLYTRLHQIKHQVELLRKCDLVLPNRKDKNSKSNYKEGAVDKFMNVFGGKKYPDLSNPNKSFHTNKIYNTLKRVKESDYWGFIVNSTNLKISQTTTHYYKK